MKKLLLFIFIAIAGQVKGQEEFINNAYYYHGELLELPVNYNAFFITSYNSVDLGTVFQQYGYTIDTLDNGTKDDERDSNMVWQLVKINNGTLSESSYNTLRMALKNNHHLIVEPVLGEDEDLRPLTVYFYVKLRNEADTAILDSMANYTKTAFVRPVSFMPLWYVLKSDSNSLGNSLEMANHFFQSGLFDEIDPGFTFKFHPACSTITDPNFWEQWGLDNLANPSLDVNACLAWGITKGSNSVKVGIVDEYNILPSPDFANVSANSYNAATKSSPAPYQSGHALHVAAVIGATHNNTMIAGLAPNSTLFVVSHDLLFTTGDDDAEELASGISWASKPSSPTCQNCAGVDIINCSWWDNGNYIINNPNQKTALLESAIDDALKNGRLGKGCIVAFATGNNGNSTVGYPAKSIPEITAVGNMEKIGKRYTTSNYGEHLDIVAPGTDIITLATPTTVTVAPNHVIGTSYATPHVSGAAALALAVNDCIAGDELRAIIESTAQKITTPGNPYTYSSYPTRPNGTWHPQMGHGLLDAHKVVTTAQAMYKPSAKDLYVKDKTTDFGIEANPDNGVLWVSSDIWVRNQNDGLINHTHQNPVYNGLTQPWVYVRVRNKGCVASAGGEQLRIHWAKASAGLSWPQPWNGAGSALPHGATIATVTLPVIAPGKEYIAAVQWFMPNPANFPNTYTSASGIGPDMTKYHFCLLARILNADPLFAAEGTNLYNNVKNNNNIAWKNFSVITFSDDDGEVEDHAIVNVGDWSSAGVTADLEFLVPEDEYGNPITDEAEVRIILDTIVWNIWQNGGAIGQGFEIDDANAHILLVTDPYVKLEGLQFGADEQGLVAVKFNFLTENSSEKTIFTYDLIQRDTTGDSIIGGERFIIHKPERTEVEMFMAEGNYNNSSQQQGLDLNAETINESAAYRWYTSDTTLVDSGSTIVVNPAQNTTYLLEVTADADGFKDYDPVSVPAQPQSWISSMSPNPATNSVTVGYHLGSSVQNAEIRIVSANNPGTVLITQSLNVNQTSKNINTSSLSPGIYIVNLYCDSNNQDGEQLVIQ